MEAECEGWDLILSVPEFTWILGMCIDIVEIWFGIANGLLLPRTQWWQSFIVSRFYSLNAYVDEVGTWIDWYRVSFMHDWS